MDKLVPYIFILIISILIILFGMGINYYSKKLGRLIKKYPSDSSEYGRGISIGIVAGMVVLILDRIINMTLNNLPSLDTSSILSIIQSTFGILIILIFISLFIILSIIYLIYQGFPKKF